MLACPRCHLKYSDDSERCFVDGETLILLPDPYVGITLKGQYRIEKIIGEGGMATVYQAQHVLIDRLVAVKILRPESARDATSLERFRREAKNAAALQHPNIIEIYDQGELDDGASFIVMELLEGATLGALMANGPMPYVQVIWLGLQMVQGLARAHDFNVLHRDLKPDNILVGTADNGTAVAKLLDFGIARSLHDPRLTAIGEIFGTPQYMAPERVTSIDAGPSADLYALGVILFQMLAGRLPFEATAITEFFLKHMSEVPPSPRQFAPDCPRELEVLVLRLLAKLPEDRPVDAHEVIRILQEMMPAEAHLSMLPPADSNRRHAPTLPPTTIDQWAGRTKIFIEMLQRAYPLHDPPPNMVVLLDAIRADLHRIGELREEGLGEQRKLESLEESNRESRLRLAHAVESLAQDLSTARKTVQDTEYQLVTMRAQLDNLDVASDGERQSSEKIVEASSDEAIECEQALLTKASDFCGSLRGRKELADLFQRLELS